mmetsp:Transcript_41647/g.63628  ORF Transcript_41647/g.63628 Transcript_41647/m.63628 type:complete len:206 (-) Transcript_41647:5125-5742(-)
MNIEGNDYMLQAVTYDGAQTAVLTSVSPRYGSVTGGDLITFTGKGFDTDSSKYTVTIDGIDCSEVAVTETTLSCTTGPRPGFVTPSQSIFIEGVGLVSNDEVEFIYVNKWTDDHTWGGEYAPMEMESIHIPKGLNLLVDIKNSPKLNAIVVEGQLIFPPDPNHDPNDLTDVHTFDAHYIFINGGKMEVGTEKFPYTSRLTITMHS